MAEVKETAGLGYAVGSATEVHESNIEMMASNDPAEAASARLSRDLINVLDHWLANERKLNTAPPDLTIAAMHGTVNIIANIAINLNGPARTRFLAISRLHLMSMYDAMIKAVEESLANEGGQDGR